MKNLPTLMKQPNQFLRDACGMVALGNQALIYDSLSECFRPKSRLNMHNSGSLYILSIIIRYFIIAPLRAFLLLLATIVSVIYLITGVLFSCDRIISSSFFLFCKLFIFIFNFNVRHHGKKSFPASPCVYVANHTTIIDFILLSSHKFSHASIAESHAGLLGFIFRVILTLNGSIAFKRSEKIDRSNVFKKVQNHIRENKAPMLIFPEGTCVNNEYTVLFQKGAFELGVPVYPVGIKYKKYLNDPYWNRRKQCFTMHILYLMTRWGVNADVFWLNRMSKRTTESSMQFAYRVKNLIAKKAELHNTLWNGYFKNNSGDRERELFKSAFRGLYWTIQNGLLEKTREEDLRKNRFYLEDKNIYRNEKTKKVFLGGLEYGALINEWCKEYIRLKESYNAKVGSPMRAEIELEKKRMGLATNEENENK